MHDSFWLYFAKVGLVLLDLAFEYENIQNEK